MAKQTNAEPVPLAKPVAEGVRFEFGTATAYAVRNTSRDIAVRVRQEDRLARRVLSRIPLLRGIVRLFAALIGLVAYIHESCELEPRRAIRGKGSIKKFAALFQTTPQSIMAVLSAFAIIAVILALMLGLPALIAAILSLIDGLPRFAINAVCCMFRVMGALLSVYIICRLRIVNRLCMYRGAAGKVINAYEAYGPDLTEEEVLLSPRLTDRSDGAFLIVVMVVSIIAFACVYTPGLGSQLVYRVCVILAAAAICNELIRPLENAGPSGRLASMRRPLTEIQHLFTIEPHSQMIEVALCAFRAAYENDLSGEE